MPRAILNGTVIADSDTTEVVEGNHYFPRDSVRMDLLRATDHSTTCPWKGEAAYFDVTVDGVTKANSAWSYPAPKDAAKQITGHIAFYPVVEVQA